MLTWWQHLNAGCTGQNYQKPQLLRHMKVILAATLIGGFMEQQTGKKKTFITTCYSKY